MWPPPLQPSAVTILAYGGLLSEASSRLTFPELTNFRLVRVRNMRRLFGMSHLFLTQQGIADPSLTLRLAALSVEPAPGASFVAAAYDAILSDDQRRAFLEREIGYDIISAPFFELDDDTREAGWGVLCAASSDARLPAELAVAPGLPHVWDWAQDSGLLPADLYLRHCLLAMQKVGGEAEYSFLHDTTLVDRATTLNQYLESAREQVMASRPPVALAERFGG
jgi:hypothetical protein